MIREPHAPHPIQAIEWDRSPAAALSIPGTAAAWDKLNAQRSDLPFLTAASVTCALEFFGDPAAKLWTGRSNGDVVAMLIAVPDGRLGWRTFQPSQLPLGALVAAPGLELSALARSLWRGPLRRALMMSLTRIDPWLAPREADVASTSQVDYVPTAWIDLDGDFDAYWARRGKNLRQNMRKQRSRLASQGVTVRTRTWTAAEDMADAIARYSALEGAGWKGAEGSAVQTDNQQGRFYRSWFERAARRGEAAVYEGMFDERTVAMNLCLRRAETLVVLKTSYDESVQSVSPAFLLHEDMLRALFAEGRTRRLEYYGRVMEWHTRWTDNQRMLYHFTAFRWPTMARLARWRIARRDSKPDAARATLPSTSEAAG